MRSGDSTLIKDRWPELYELVVSAAAVDHALSDEERGPEAVAETVRVESARLGVNPLRVMTLARHVNAAFGDSHGQPMHRQLEEMIGLYIMTHLVSREERDRAVASMRDRVGKLPSAAQVSVVTEAMELTAEMDRRMDACEAQVDYEERPQVETLAPLMEPMDRARSRAVAAGIHIPFADMSTDYSGRIKKLGDKLDEVLERHGHRDYAPHTHDMKERLLHGVQVLRDGGTLDFWYLMSDLGEYVERGARHEVSSRDLREVRDALASVAPQMAEQLKSTNGRMAELDARAREIQDQLRRVTNAYGAGPAHIEALEMQYLALRVNERLHLRDHGNVMAALQDMTLLSLRHAGTYCWATMPVEAVASSAQSLRPEMALGSETLGSLAAPGTCGFWWFQKPIPVQTMDQPGAEVPVVALLWRRVMDPDGSQNVWMSTMVMLSMDVGGRQADVPVPTTSWYWKDGLRLCELDAHYRNQYARIYGSGRQGGRFANPDATVAAAVWFSRFFLSASAWLRQRIVVAERGDGTRQIGRSLQREHKLAEAPQVRVVHLRRRETATVQSVTDDTAQPGGTRKLTCRFVVPGFWRNQWYPSVGQHKAIYIEDFVKGPAGAPFKTKANVYAVVR
jgi:hypothetical protein